MGFSGALSAFFELVIRAFSFTMLPCLDALRMVAGNLEQRVMQIAIDRHQAEIRRNLDSWRKKPLLQAIYSRFYRRIMALMDAQAGGAIVEIGSGIGNLKSHLPQAIATDLFPNPWLDLVCDAYELPFEPGSLSHLILFDVFHHLEAPNAFLEEAKRVLAPQGRVLLFEPYISWFSYPVYGLLHHEPVALRDSINRGRALGRPRHYYAAQGNATRLFFETKNPLTLEDWDVFHTEAFACFGYLLSGGFSRRALYPNAWLDVFQRLDQMLSRWPALFGGRCLVGLKLRLPS